MCPHGQNQILQEMINNNLILDDDAILDNDEEIASSTNDHRNDTSNNTDTSSNADNYSCVSKVILMEMNKNNFNNYVDCNLGYTRFSPSS